MKIGVVGTSRKENERRLPIYPEHLPWINAELRRQLMFERDYGNDFGVSDGYFEQLDVVLGTREELFEKCAVLLLPKPVIEDLRQMKEHQILWGWAHCVQQRGITQTAIDNKLTIIAWEAMHHWSSSGERLVHVFYKNNELAGYAAVLHTLQLLGIDGLYGPRRKVIVLGYGSVSRGAIYALEGRGFNNINVYSTRPVHLIADQNPDVYYRNMFVGDNGQMLTRSSDGMVRPLIQELSEADIICNGVLQDTDNPMMFVRDDELSHLRPRSIIIDVSCDEGMGFSFAKPTSFDDPIFTVGNGIVYYSVDHTPSYLWNAASREISRSLIPYLRDIAVGPVAWERNSTIQQAIEIQDGVIRNRKILTFQRRGQHYPHCVL